MYNFKGRWITDCEFSDLKPRRVFKKQLEKLDLPCTEHLNCHILFRRKFSVTSLDEAKIFITADDYYKLYINGTIVAQGPAPAHHYRYNYNEIDITSYLQLGENTIAIHTYYQGLINRVWQSGDNRHGLLLDLVQNGRVLISSDTAFKTARHTAYKPLSITSPHKPQFNEEYDSRAAEVGFEAPDFDDSHWQQAEFQKYNDRSLMTQSTKMLTFEKIDGSITRTDNGIIIDFGAVYVGYLRMKAYGRAGDKLIIRCGQELDENGVRYQLRCNTTYDESWILADGESILDWYDYKSFRYAEIFIPDGVTLSEIYLQARHYPFEQKTGINPKYADDCKLKAIFELCANSLRYGIQETIQDCMDREKGFYMGDACYSTLTHTVLTGDDSMMRKLIDDAFAYAHENPGLVTCLDCSFMQEIAEYPLMLVTLVLWHYRLTGDKDYLAVNYPKAAALLDYYRRTYEKNLLLTDLDRWCVVEWPMEFRDGYDVDITEGKICTEPHVSINAYYIEAINNANKMAKILNTTPYRDTKKLTDNFIKIFYIPEKHRFRDGVHTEHTSIVGNVFPYAFGIHPDNEFVNGFTDELLERKISTFSMFCTFIALEGVIRNGRKELIAELMSDEGAWLRTLREDGKRTFEGWGRDTKKNASLFHLALTYGAFFLADTEISKIFE